MKNATLKDFCRLQKIYELILDFFARKLWIMLDKKRWRGATGYIVEFISVNRGGVMVDALTFI